MEKNQEEESYQIWCKDCNNMFHITEEHICSTLDSNICDNYADSKNDSLESLISAVFENEPLWNSRLPYRFRGPSDIKALWADIDRRLGKVTTVEKEDTNSYCEKAILKELERTRPTNQSKPDEIESFTKYLEACLRNMTTDNSKHITKQILKLIAEADI